MIETFITAAGFFLYSDLTKPSNESYIKSTLSGLPTEIAGSIVERYYDIVKDKLKERFPRLIRDNSKTLCKSVRLSQLNAIGDICADYRKEISGQNSETYNLEPIKQIEKYLSDEKAKLTQGNFQDINVSDDEIKQILSVDKFPQNIQSDAGNALIRELPNNKVLPTGFVELLQNNVFERFEVNFNAELANSEVANVLFKKALSGIQFSLEELLAGQNNQTNKIEELGRTLIKRTNELERLGYQILYTDGKCSGIEFIGEKLNEIDETTKRIEEKLDNFLTAPKPVNKYSQIAFTSLSSYEKLTQQNNNENETFSADWTLIDNELLNGFRSIPSKNKKIAAKSFFNIREPNWADAVSEYISKRKIVFDINKNLNEDFENNTANIAIIFGNGGEGKSTILRQVICDLLTSNTNLKVYFSDSRNCKLETYEIAQLQNSKDNYLIAVDNVNPDSIYIDLAVKFVHDYSINNIQFLLSYRTVDWNSLGENLIYWESRFPKLRQYEISLDNFDARTIVNKWFDLKENEEKAGLIGKSLQEVTNELYNNSCRKNSEQIDENTYTSLLAGLVKVREKVNIKSYVAKILSDIKSSDKKYEGKLLELYFAIVILDAEDFEILTPEIITKFINAKNERETTHFLNHLRGEIIINHYNSKMILSRHRVIAENATKLLIERFDQDAEYTLKNLIRSSQKVWRNLSEEYERYKFKPISNKYKELPDYFFAKKLGVIKENKHLGIELAKEFCRLSPNDAKFLTDLSKLYRKSGQLDECLRLFSDLPFTHNHAAFEKTFSFYSEWGTLLSKQKNFIDDISIVGFSLSDQSDVNKKMNNWNPTDTKICLNRLAYSFKKLFELNSDELFKLAFISSVRVGLRVTIEGKASITHEDLLQKEVFISRIFKNNTNFKPEQLIKHIIDGIIGAFSRRTVNLKPLLNVTDFSFIELRDEITKYVGN